jgi:hypothetical protein
LNARDRFAETQSAALLWKVSMLDPDFCSISSKLKAPALSGAFLFLGQKTDVAPALRRPKIPVLNSR